MGLPALFAPGSRTTAPVWLRTPHSASTHPRRVAAFEGIKQIVYRVVDVEAFHYDELTKKKYVAMAKYLAKLHAAM